MKFTKNVIKIILMGMLFSMLVSCSKKEDSNQAVATNPEVSFTQDNSTEQEVISIARHPRPVDFSVDCPEQYKSKMNQLPEHSGFGYDIRSVDLTGADLTKDYNKLIDASFDSKTIWPKTLPNGFNPSEVMELYKNPGLNVKSLHERGITGKGIGIAIIDQNLLVDHSEYKDQLKYYNEHNYGEDDPASLHGAAVASIAVGKTVGVAPDANLYYIADNLNNDDKSNEEVAGDINEVLDLNKTLPNENRIRVISISWGFDIDITAGQEKIKEAYARAKSEGVFVITTSISSRENMEFFGLNKIPLSDPDDYNTYDANLYSNSNSKYKISVPMSFRTVASPTGENDYVVYSDGGLSWSTPYVAGLYALACQVSPDVTYDQFWELASETSRSSHGVYNGKSYEAKYIVDPVAMIDKLIEKK